MTGVWRKGPHTASVGAWLVALLLYAAGMAATFRNVLWHGGSIGDDSDGGIVLAILEHWVRVFSGQAVDWRSPGWYWPAPHALGLSDSLFMLAVPYALARAAGAGWFAANDIAVATLATAGFWGMVLLVRRLGGLVPVGAVMAAIFSFGAVPIFKLGHEQTYTIQLAPALGLLLVAAWQRRSGVPAAGAGLLYGLMFFTAAQTPWFLGLEAAMALGAGALLCRLDRPRALRLFPGFAVGLAAGMVPFVLLYRDSAGLMRGYSEAHYYSGWPRDLIGVPPGEAMWSALLHGAGLGSEPARPFVEVALGLTPVLAISALVALGMTARRRNPAAALLAAGLLGPLSAVDWGGVEPWKLVYWLVPGGTSVRTPFRIELAALFFVCLGLGLSLSQAVARSSAWARVGLAALAVLLLAEQWGEPPSGRDNATTAWLSTARRPDFACDVFYVLPGGGGEPWHRVQSDAMLLSVRLGMPTVNGNSSFFPAGWDMSFTDRADYAGRMLAWIDAHGARQSVCGTDPRRGIWVPGVEPLEAR